MAKYINPYTDFGFKKLFGEEGLAGYTHEERDRYEHSLIQYRDLKSALETAVEDRSIEIAKNAILEGADNRFIAKITGLTIEEVETICAELKKKN